MKYFIILAAMVTMLAIPHDALARTSNDDKHMVITHKPKRVDRLCRCRKKKKTKKIDMGTFKCTAYCPCESCSDDFGRRTHSGTTAESGRTVAVDPDVIDIGSKVKIGKHTYVAEDTGGRVVGDTIDIFFDTHEEVEDFEVKYRQVYVLRGK